MRKCIILLFILFFKNHFSQTHSSGIKITIEEKTKGGKKFLSNEDVTIRIINNTSPFDTLILKTKTSTLGEIEKIETSPGNKNVIISHNGCLATEIKYIIVGEGKTAYLVFALSCSSYINSLSKKEKRKLGYK